MAGSVADVTALAAHLDAAGISYEIAVLRYEAVAFLISVPGERWEVEMMVDGSVEVEVFASDGTIHDAAKLDDLFARFSD